MRVAIDTGSLNNGFDLLLNGNTLKECDFLVTRLPTLKDLIYSNGELNNPMFDVCKTNDLLGGIFVNYNFKEIHSENNNLDRRLMPEGYLQFLDMTNEEQNELIAFLNTLRGNDVYTNEKWSDSFK